MAHGTYTQCMDVAVLILPTLLQQAGGFAHVLAGNGFSLAETCFTYASSVTGRIVFIVKLERFGLASEGNANTHLGHRIGTAGDGFHHGARIDTASSQDADVDYAYGLAFHDMSIQLGALAMTRMLVGIDAYVGFHNATHLGIHIAVCPRASSLIGEGSLAIESTCGAHFIEGLILTTHQHTLMYVTCNPCIEITILQHFFVCVSTDSQHGQHTYKNCLFHSSNYYIHIYIIRGQNASLILNSTPGLLRVSPKSTRRFTFFLNSHLTPIPALGRIWWK